MLSPTSLGLSTRMPWRCGLVTSTQMPWRCGYLSYARLRPMSTWYTCSTSALSHLSTSIHGHCFCASIYAWLFDESLSKTNHSAWYMSLLQAWIWEPFTNIAAYHLDEDCKEHHLQATRYMSGSGLQLPCQTKGVWIDWQWLTQCVPRMVCTANIVSLRNLLVLW